MNEPSTVTPARVTLVFAGFVIVGAPMAYYIWRVLSDLLAGHFRPLPALGALALLVLLAVILKGLAGYVGKLEGGV